MRKCLQCCNIYSLEIIKCIICENQILYLEKFESFAPDLAKSSKGFKANYFSNLFLLEDKNFWFRSRNKLIINKLKKYRPNFETFFEIGCGTGYVLSGVSECFKNAKFFGSEIFIEGLNFASQRIPKAHFMQMDARTIPFSEAFEIIGAFDVLEHIEEDEIVLKEINKSLKQNGLLFLTIPQHSWLWSNSDDYACHVRRYSKREIHDKLKNNGFRIIKSTSFVSFLLPLMLLSRYRQRKKDLSKFNPSAELDLPKFLNQFLYLFMLIEIFLIKIGINFPIGGSRFVIAEKQNLKD